MTIDTAAVASATAGPRHFLDLLDLPKAEIRKLLDAALARKAARAGLPKGAADPDKPLNGQVLGSLFAHPSTRTRVSMDMAMHQLGGRALELQGGSLQTGRGESFADTGRVLSRYVDILSFRAVRHGDLVEMAQAATVPVINALTDRSHPCQILADVMTLAERFGDVSQLTLAWAGDGNNVLTSLMEGAALFGYALRIACPASRAPDGQIISRARAAGAAITLCETAADAISGVDAVYADTWVSMGDAIDETETLFGAYRVDEALMALAAPEAIFLHCLPAHRGEEVTAGVIDGPQSAVWDQAENRLHAQKAVILYCLGLL